MSDNSINENSEVDHIIKSSEILLSLSSEWKSFQHILQQSHASEVASIEFSTIPLNPSIFAVDCLSIEILVPPTGPAPRGDSLTLPYVL